MNDRIAAGELLPGDVLLYHGPSWVSEAIRFFDGTNVNHSAIYLGDGRVGEAREFKGVVRQPLSVSIAGTDWVLVRRLPAAALDPVVARARLYINNGDRYAYEQILLLALLCLTRKVELSAIFSRLVRAVLDKAASYFSNIAAGVTGGEPMICSEFVFRCYDEADPRPDDPYSLKISGRPPRNYWLHAMPATAAAAAIDAESLLGMLVAKPATTGIPALPLERSYLAVERIAPKQSKIDALIRQYVGKAEPQKPPPAEEEVDLAQLQDAVHNLALWVYEAAGHEVDRGLLETHPYSIRSPSFSHFLQIAADFITPGDLLKTPSLETLGMLR